MASIDICFPPPLPLFFPQGWLLPSVVVEPLVSDGPASLLGRPRPHQHRLLLRHAKRRRAQLLLRRAHGRRRALDHLRAGGRAGKREGGGGAHEEGA